MSESRIGLNYFPNPLTRTEPRTTLVSVKTQDFTEKEKHMYTSINFKTKKQLKEAVAAGKQVTVYQPGPFGGNEPKDGTVYLEGPHYPEAHRWYAQGTMKDGVLVGVK